MQQLTELGNTTAVCSFLLKVAGLRETLFKTYTEALLHSNIPRCCWHSASCSVCCAHADNLTNCPKAHSAMSHRAERDLTDEIVRMFDCVHDDTGRAVPQDSSWDFM
jgi:hypothetical protein